MNAINEVVVDEKKDDIIEVHQNLQVLTERDRHMKLMESAVQNKLDIASIDKLVELQINFEMREARKSFFNSLSKFKRDLPTIPKNGIGHFTTKTGQKVTYPYALIEDIAKAINPILYKCGLSYRFEMKTGSIITVKCIVSHNDGHSVSTEMSGPPDKTGFKNEMQAIGSSTKYLERYTLTGAFGIMTVGEDNDAADVAPHVDNNEPKQYYSDEEFKNVFPNWSDRIKKGLNTKNQLMEFLETKGIALKEDQYEEIQNIRIEE